MKKLLTTILAGLIICFTVNAQGSDGKCISGNCDNGIGTYVLLSKTGETVATYKGSFKDGIMDGKGTLSFPDGVYTGEWKKGVQEGAGTFLYKNGKKFTGTFSKGDPMNGNGYYFFIGDKSSYEGTFVNGKFSGMGTRTTSEWTLSGNFIDGELNGNGKWTSSDGDKYEGNFKDGNFDGYGVATSKDGWVYKGNWTKGKKNGAGSKYDANGNLEYNGDWTNGEMTHPERSVSYKKQLWEDSKKIFSRVTFKGELLAENVNIEVTDEYHLNSDYSLYGTHEVTMIYEGENENEADEKYRFKLNFTGTYDPVTNKIHTVFGSTIHKDEFPDHRSWVLIGVDATVYNSSNHSGYYVIKGKDTGDEFAETDYY